MRSHSTIAPKVMLEKPRSRRAPRVLKRDVLEPTIKVGTPICQSWFAWKKKDKMSMEVDFRSLAHTLLDVEPPLKESVYPQASRCKELTSAKVALPCGFSFESSFLEGDVCELNQNIARKYLGM